MKNRIICSLLCCLLLFSASCSGNIDINGKTKKTNAITKEEVLNKNQEKYGDTLFDVSNQTVINALCQDLTPPDENASLEEFVKYGLRVISRYSSKTDYPHGKVLIQREANIGRSKLYFAEDKERVLQIINDTVARMEKYILPQEEATKMLSKTERQFYPDTPSEAIEPRLAHYLGEYQGEHVVLLTPVLMPGTSMYDYYVALGGYFFSNYIGELGLWNGERYIYFVDAYYQGVINRDFIEEFYADYTYMIGNNYSIVTMTDNYGSNLESREENENLLIKIKARAFNLPATTTPMYYDGESYYGEGLWFDVFCLDIESVITDKKSCYEIGYVTESGKGVLRRTTSLDKGSVIYNEDKTINDLRFCGFRRYSIPPKEFQDRGWIQFYVKEIGVESSIVYSPKIYYTVKPYSEDPYYNQYTFSKFAI